MAVKKRLGEMLVEAGIIDETQLHAALGHQRQWGGRLGQCLVEMKLASEEAIVDALAVKFGFEVARLDQLEPYAFEQARALVPLEYATRNSIFPISADTAVLTVAMSDPTNLSLTDELAFRSGRRIKVCIAGENAVAAAVRHYYGEDAATTREAIDLGADDGAMMEPIYDPIGATSSEEMSRFYQQEPAHAAPARGPAAPARTAPAAAPTRTASPAAPAPPAPPPPAARAAARPAPAPAPRAAAAPATPPAAPVAAPPPRKAPRSAAELQLEDQPTGSIPLEATASILLDPALADDAAEELQPIPLDAEPLGEESFLPADGAVPQEDAAYAQGDAAYPQGDAAYAQGDLGYAQSDATYAQGDAAYASPDAAYAQPDPYAPEQAPYEEEWVEGPVRQRELTAEEAMILDELGRLAGGDEAAATIVRPAQLLATLIRLLIRKQVITEQELLDEILRG